MPVTVEKIPGGFSIDGLLLKAGKCGCTSIAKCCYTLSKIKKKSDALYEFNAKLFDNETTENFDWGYTVSKEGVTVKVEVQDARDKQIFSGYMAPPLEAWQQLGWSVEESHGAREDGKLWRCSMCRWLYKEKQEGTAFEQLPESWACPTCKAGRGSFEDIG